MHLSPTRRPHALLIAVAALLIPLAAPLAAHADEDPGAVGVARISLIDGSVAVQRGDSAAPIDAVVNAPVLAADYITTGEQSHAEVQFDGASALRLGDNVQMRFTRIDPGNRQLQLAQGTIELRLLQGADGENVIDTPSVSIHPLDGGSYRVSVDPDGRTIINVRSGRAEVALPQGNQVIESGGALEAQGPASGPQVQSVQAIAMDGFDSFNNDRDAHEMPAVAQNGGEQQYVSPSIPGGADLNADGRWVPDPEVGQVWVPSDVPQGWAPYRDGRWVYEPYYGYTWIGYEPWGWAPYHYGRWYHSASYGWAWYPGPRVAVSAWSPALVAFVGFGGGVGIGLGFGNIGWVPLAPHEAFHPWWGRGGTSINVAFNFGHNEYRNVAFNGATYVSHERFTQGRFDHALAMTPGQFRSGQVMHGSIPVAPTRETMRFNDRPVAPNLAVRQPFTQRAFAGGESRFTRTTTAPRGDVGATRTGPAYSRGSSNEAWSRFGTARPSYSNGNTGGNTYSRPSYNNGNTGTNAYQRPSYNNGTASGNTYQRPSYNNGGSTYSRPSYNNGNTGTNAYQRPSYNNGTASGNTYQRPSYNNGGSTYSRPSYNNGNTGTNTYSRPSYNNGGSTYSRPSYNNGGGSYQRPSYNNGGSSYSRPSYNNGSGYQRATRSTQSTRSASPSPRNTGAAHDRR